MVDKEPYDLVPLDGVSVTHFENKQLKKVRIRNSSIYPIYFRVVYKRSSISVKSILLEKYFEFEPDLGKYLDYLIQLDKVVIESIAKKMWFDKNSDFSLELFKIYYKRYSVDISEIISKSLFEKSLVFLADLGLPKFSQTISRSMAPDIGKLMELLKELELKNDPNTLDHPLQDVTRTIDLKSELTISFYSYFLEFNKFHNGNIMGPSLKEISSRVYIPAIVLSRSGWHALKEEEAINMSIYRASARYFPGSEEKFLFYTDKIELFLRGIELALISVL